MKLTKWLTISSNKAARITATKPTLSSNEISICLDIDLPDALFNKPQLVAAITVPDEAASDKVIKGLVVDNIEDAIHQATDLEFRISIGKEDETP